MHLLVPLAVAYSPLAVPMLKILTTLFSAFGILCKSMTCLAIFLFDISKPQCLQGSASLPSFRFFCGARHLAFTITSFDSSDDIVTSVGVFLARVWLWGVTLISMISVFLGVEVGMMGMMGVLSVVGCVVVSGQLPVASVGWVMSKPMEMISVCCNKHRTRQCAL